MPIHFLLAKLFMHMLPNHHSTDFRSHLGSRKSSEQHISCEYFDGQAREKPFDFPSAIEHSELWAWRNRLWRAKLA
jgi:hypothetical protein